MPRCQAVQFDLYKCRFLRITGNENYWAYLASFIMMQSVSVVVKSVQTRGVSGEYTVARVWRYINSIIIIIIIITVRDSLSDMERT